MDEAQTSATPEERLSAFFNNEPAPEPKAEAPEEPEQTTQEEESVEPDGLLADDTQDDEPQVVEPDADGLEVVYNGETLRVPKDEARNLAQLGMHLKNAQEKVTSELAAAQQQAKQIAELATSIQKTAPEIQSLSSQLQALEMMVSAEGLTPQAIYQMSLQDPARATEMQAKLNAYQAQYNATRNNLNGALATMKQRQETLEQQNLAAERQVLQKVLPQTRDAAKFEQLQQNLHKSISNLRPQTIKAIDSNAEIFAAFAKAAEYDRLQSSKKDKVAQAEKAPAVVKPGVANASSTTQDRVKKARDQLRKSGSVEDAARLLRMMR